MRKQDKIGEFKVGIDPIPIWIEEAAKKGHVEVRELCIDVNGKATFWRGVKLTRLLFNHYMRGAIDAGRYAKF